MENNTLWISKDFKFKKKRGCHYITKDIINGLPELKKVKVGLLNLFIQHTSAGLCISESYDSDVMKDLEASLDRLAPEDDKLYLHNSEGSDDCPAHIKNVIMGSSINIPIRNGELMVGTWQGIIFCEFRDEARERTVIATLNGSLIS
jgi:secondary thiamine-phosphate synthase enzyme